MGGVRGRTAGELFRVRTLRCVLFPAPAAAGAGCEGLQAAELAPRRGEDIVPQFAAGGAAAVAVVRGQNVPQPKCVQVGCARFETRPAVLLPGVLAPQGARRGTPAIGAMEQIYFSGPEGRFQDGVREGEKTDGQSSTFRFRTVRIVLFHFPAFILSRTYIFKISARNLYAISKGHHTSF